MVFIESRNTLHNTYTYKPLQSTVVTAYIPLFTKSYFGTQNAAALENLWYMTLKNDKEQAH
jgi:hypothetical protein